MTDTYIDIQNRIADELGGRSDLTSQIQLAIQTAIQKWQRERFYFNEFILAGVSGGPFNTVSGQEFYTSSDYAPIATLAHIDKMWALVSGNRYFINPRTSQYIADVSVNPTNTSIPVDYAFFAEQIRFYPIPNNAYPVGLLGTQRLATLVNGGDTNSWVTGADAEALIRTEAKMDLYENVLQSPDMADRMRLLIHGNPLVPGSRGYLYALRAETQRRIPEGGRIRPTHF